jgi:type IV secretory pathway TraG/TraD family ATPase VirD4
LVAIIGVFLSIVVGGGLVVVVAALLAGHALPKLTVSAIQHGVVHWHSFAGDPRNAFPPPLRGQLPGPVGMYASVAVCATLFLMIGIIVMWLLLNRPSRAERERRDRLRQGLARSRRRTRPLLVATKGLAVAAPFEGGGQLIVPAERSVGVIMPPRSGKSSSAVGYILDSRGAVLTASSSQELLLTTAVMREQSTHQPTLAFDPLGVTGWPNYVRWSPITGCDRPQTAARRAEALLSGSRIDETANGGFWRASGSLLLRRVLLACALAEAGVEELRAWMADPFDTNLNDVVAHSAEARAWMHDLTLMTRQRGETLDSVAVMTSLALECFQLPQVRKACSPERGQNFDPQQWISSGGTLHVLAADEQTTPVTPITVALIDEVLVAAVGFGAASWVGGNGNGNGRKPSDPLLRVILDDLASVSPLPRLSSHLTDDGSRGIQIVWYARSRAQLAERFGRERGAAVISATSTMLYGGGLNDPELLRDVSSMLGQVVVRQRTNVTDRLGFRSFGEQYRPAAVLDPSEFYQLPPFEAVMLTGGAGGNLVRLIPWWKRGDAELIRQSIVEATNRCRLVT